MPYTIDSDQVRKLLQAVEQSASTVVITDTRGTIEYVNKRFTELTGYSRDECIGKNPRMIRSGNTPNNLYADMWKAIVAGDEWRGELQNRKKNGELYWVSLTVSPIKNEKGETTNFLGIEEDISRRKYLEAELQRKMLELERSNAELAGFNSVISHDLNGPLGNIAFGIDFVLEHNSHELSPDSHKLLTIACNSAKKCSRLVKDLLQYARVDGARHVFTEVDLSEIIDSIADSLHFQIEQEHGKIERTDLPIVRGSRTLLSQLFQNLIANALNYRSEKNPLIKISAQRGEGEWTLSVSDNGVGIEPAECSKIFDPFYRIASTSSRPGTGIGLALCKKVAETHGGRIWVESTTGSGATFHLVLPDKKL